MRRVLAVILVTVGVARAQPSLVTPTTTPSAPPAPPIYSRSLVERPLLLPEGAIEISLALDLRNDQRGSFAPRVVYATPIAELQLGVDYQLSDRPTADTPWISVSAGGRRELIPCRVPGLSLGALIVAQRPGGEEHGVSPSLVLEYKRRLAHFFAVQPSLALGYDFARVTFDDGLDVIDGSVHQLDGALGLRAQLQAGRVLALEVLVAAGYYQDLGDYAALGVSSHGEQRLGITASWSLSNDVDVRFIYTRSMRALELASDGVALALDLRRI